MSKKFKRLSILFVVSLLFVVSIVSCFAFDISSSGIDGSQSHLSYNYFDNLDDAVSFNGFDFFTITSSTSFDDPGYYLIRFDILTSSTGSRPDSFTFYFNDDPVTFVRNSHSGVSYTVSVDIDVLNIIYPSFSSSGSNSTFYYAILEVEAPSELAIILGGIPDVTDTVLTTATDIADTIVATPLLLLMCVGLPVVSFGAGLLVRLIRRA